MPIFRAGPKLVFFAHVPKCGGHSVETYLADRFGAVAFRDTAYIQLPEARRWSRSSPQHADRASLARLFPDGFFDASFAVVRDPADRAISDFHMQMRRRRAQPRSFSPWLAKSARLLESDPFSKDNHLRPQDDIVPEGAVIFRLEDGLDRIISWLDDLAGDRAGPRAMPVEMKHDGPRLADRNDLTSDDWQYLWVLYRRDYDRFGYSVPEGMITDPDAGFPRGHEKGPKSLLRRFFSGWRPSPG